MDNAGCPASNIFLSMFKFLNYGLEQCDQCDRLKIPPPSTPPKRSPSKLLEPVIVKTVSLQMLIELKF